jgi:regulator of replication initiation timing
MNVDMKHAIIGQLVEQNTMLSVQNADLQEKLAAANAKVEQLEKAAQEAELRDLTPPPARPRFMKPVIEADAP